MSMNEEKRKFLKEVKREIDSWNKYSSSIFGCTLQELKDFLKDVQIGYYDKLFKDPKKISLRTILSWHKIRLFRQTHGIFMHKITRENYEVYHELLKIKDHIKYLKEFHGMNGKNQTPPTEREELFLKQGLRTIISTDYTKEEVEEIKRKMSLLDIEKSSIFPHNVKEIIAAFHPNTLTVSKKYKTSPLIREPLTVQEQAATTLNFLEEHTLSDLFSIPPTSIEDAYIRRMILSQINIKRLIETNCNGFIKTAIKRVKDELEQNLTLSEKNNRLLWNQRKLFTTTKEESKVLRSLTRGVLLSLLTPPGPIDISKEIKISLKDNDCTKELGLTRNKMVVGPRDYVYSMSKDEIPSFYEGIQDRYNELYQNTDGYEYVEGCVEILGDLLMAQTLGEGNKRVAKCLFHKMLLSKNIVPPIIDLTDNDYEMFYNFADSRGRHYSLAKERILEDTKELSENWMNGNFYYPVHIDKSYEKVKK